MNARKPHFIDLRESHLRRQEEASEIRRRLTLVRNSEEPEAEDENSRLVEEYGLATDGASLITARLKCSPQHRALIDAVIGCYHANKGKADKFGFSEITDEQLARRAGRSTKWVQENRNEFRSWSDHGALIEIKDHWRDPETGASHAHAYRPHIDKLAVEVVQIARKLPAWVRDRSAALEEAACIVGDSAPGFPPRASKNKRTRSLAEQQLKKLETAARLIEEATALQGMIHNPDFERLGDAQDALQAAVAALAQAIEPADPPLPISTLNTLKEQVEIRGQVEKNSTQNAPLDSTVYENSPAEEVKTPLSIDPSPPRWFGSIAVPPTINPVMFDVRCQVIAEAQNVSLKAAAVIALKEQTE